MKLGSLFDGIGGALLCAKACAIKPVWASEIEPFPIKVTEYHFPTVKHLGDITQINGAKIEPVDIVVGGSPCQDLSVAGKRAGMAGERSGLFIEQIRIIKEMRNGTNKPRYMVWENVPRAFSSNDGEDFRAVLEETARVAEPTVSIPRSVNGWANSGSVLADGFSISWRTFDAQYWGVPQRRRRIYLVADFAGQSAPEILFKSESVSGDITEGRGKGERTTGDAEGGAGEASADKTKCLTPWDNQSKRIFDPRGCYPTLQAMNGGGANNTAIICSATQQGGDSERCAGEASGVVSKGNGEAFLMREKHMALACGGGQAGQGYPCVLEKPIICSATQQGGAEPIVYMRGFGGRTSEEGITPTLEAAAGMGGNNQPIVCYDMTHANDVIRESGDKTPTLQNRMGTGGNQAPITCYGIGGYNSEGMKSKNPKSGIYKADTARTIDQNGGNPACNQGGIAVCRMVAFGEYTTDGTTSAQKQRDYKDATDLVVAKCLKAKGNLSNREDSDTLVPQHKQVRRLTPLECERLQGYPDNYTNIPGASDSARYKALGNSFAIPNALFVIKAIADLQEGVD